jgi:HEAT repeat protein
MSNLVGVFTTDRDLVVQVWDSTLARMTGIHCGDATGRRLPDVVPELESRDMIRFFNRVLEQGVVEVLAPAFHHYLIPCAPQTPSPRFEHMRQRVTIAPLERDGHVGGLIVTVEDVTQRLDHERDIASELEQHSPVKHLIGALDDENWRVRLKAVEEMSQRAAPDAIAELLIAVRDNHHNLGLLNSALKVLRFSDVDTHSTLVGFLKSPDADLRIQAALALGEQEDARAIPALLEATRDENVNVVYHAIEALGKLRAQAAIDRLLEFADSNDFFLAFPALHALGEIGNSRVSARIIPFLKNEMLLEPAADALSKIGDEFAVEALIGILNSRNAPTEVIARCLTDLHDRAEALHQEGSYIANLYRNSIRATGVQNLIDALAAADAENLRPLVWLLGHMDSPQGARALAWRLGSPELRNEILEALVRHGSSVTELLIDQLQSEEPDIRAAAVTALGRVRDKRATPALTRMLVTDPELTIPVIAALTFTRDPAAVDSLFSMLGTEDAAIRKATVGALNALGTPETVKRVIPLLADPNPGVREAAVCIVGYFGYPECVEALLSRCQDADENVRRAAIEQMPYLEDSRTSKVLTDALRAEVPAVRAAAAAAMAHMEPSGAASSLIAALGDDDPWVRYFSARSLDRHRTMESAAELHRLAQFDRFHQVRIAAFEALCRIDTGMAASIANLFRASGNPDLQEAAATSGFPRSEPA